MPVKNAVPLENMLPDAFSKTLLAGGLEVLETANPIRAHLFAAALREVVGYLLQEMAPDEELAEAPWFVLDGDRPTRKQRMTFAIQGGMSVSTVDELGVDAADMHKEMSTAIGELNKRTHVRPGTLLVDPGQIEAFADGVVDAVIEFRQIVADMRDAVAGAVVHNASAPVFGSFLQEANDMIDALSTHSFVEQVDVEEVRVVRIGAYEITYEAEGTVYVELNYGSSSDRARGEGATTTDSYPFKCKMMGSVDDLSDIHDVCDIEVDTASFYESPDED
ncbi:MAG TPA: hypothetical protein VFP12_14140 [Allosphingosinicella sp.]|nr:hypothetical protein [Allosphingosinicella sp.]